MAARPTISFITVYRAVLSSLICLFVAGGGHFLSKAQAANLTRGPFLQKPSPYGLTIHWLTDQPSGSVVRYGTAPDNLTWTANRSTPVTNHQVQITGLNPSTRYYYSVGSRDETLAEGADHWFFTSPAADQSVPTRIWVLGDPGQITDGGNGQQRVRDAYRRFTGSRHTDALLALGDNTFRYGTELEFQTNFFDVYREFLKNTPVWSCIGNHEVIFVPPGKTPPYFDVFFFPTNGESGGVASGREEYYSFDHGDIHFIALDSQTVSRSSNGPMAKWLRDDLAANRKQWTIAFFHHPPYSKGWYDSDDDFEIELVEMRQNILPILEAGGVDLVLNGHSHVYERSHLIHGHYGYSPSLKPEMILDDGGGREREMGSYIKPVSGVLANKGTVYVEVGCSASVRQPYSHHPVTFFDEPALGSLVIDISSNRLDAAFLRDNGKVDDSFTIVKGEPEPLRVRSLTLRDGKVMLRWKSRQGQIYQVERSETQRNSHWQPVGDSVMATGATTSWTNAVPPGAILNLYRVTEIGPDQPLDPSVDLSAAGLVKSPTASLYE